MEFVNCPNCNEVFVKNNFRDVCPKCWEKEEKDFETVKNFLRKRENRAATIEQIVEQTGVDEKAIIKFVKKGRLQKTQFPNLGYPCERCGHIITKGLYCEKCISELRTELETFQKEEQRKKEILEREKRTYLSKKP